MTDEKTVLVIEDEVVIAELLKEVLSGAGYKVLLAHRVDEALQQDLPAVSLFLSDFLLPDRTGLDLAVELEQRGIKQPVILMSAFLERDVRQKVLAVPAVVEVLKKPLDIFAVRQKVDRILGGETTPGSVSATPAGETKPVSSVPRSVQEQPKGELGAGEL